MSRCSTRTHVFNDVVRRCADRSAHSVRLCISVRMGIRTQSPRYDTWGMDGPLANTLEAEGVTTGVVVSVAIQAHGDTHFALVPYERVQLKGRGAAVKTFDRPRRQATMTTGTAKGR
eukprot:TRINITY_DN76916_c0_g1_i1.p2 TRINITY_DN76916_c0_g1~~TRINITY_DN76916_c0_g1_i1.p2  ORF type:complete len:117 (+),score=43.65 TRINITY_DN76916_c0_g1_i1:73-423(+)